MPVVGKYLPRGQFWHADASAAPAVVEYLPVEQSPEHVASDVAPVDPENRPGAQFKHDDTPRRRVEEYLPATHTEHAEAPAVAVILPARQLTHVSTEDAAAAAEYLPGRQLPAHVEAPCRGEYLPAAQSRHVKIDALAVEVENLPASHEEQASAPWLE